MEQPRYLILENGRVFRGRALGATGQVIAEIVFTTAMTGYLETLTDPSYYGQMVVQAFPLIGNYGVISADFEEENPALKAYIVRSWCQVPSNFRSEEDLDTFLLSKGIVGLCDIDTRALVKIIREHGVMNALLTDDPAPDSATLEKLRAYRIDRAVQAVSRSEASLQRADKARLHVALWDFGAKRNIANELRQRGCDVSVVPASTTAEEILALKPDGIMLSNGAGDPAENTQCIAEIKQLLGKVPIFGICLGHQLLALAAGAKTEKLRYGHRGGNQPVKNLESGRVYITSQNHGYAVLSDSLDSNIAKLSYVNLNDNTCEGLDYPTLNAFSLQFHPEAHCGPRDMRFAFKKFLDLMNGGKN